MEKLLTEFADAVRERMSQRGVANLKPFPAKVLFGHFAGVHIHGVCFDIAFVRHRAAEQYLKFVF